MKKIFLLGSSGSIGLSTLDVIRKFPDHFKVEALTVNSNIEILESQIEEFSPEIVVVRDKNAAKNLSKNKLKNSKILVGDEGLLEATRSVDYDILLSALVGFAGLAPTIEGIKRGKRIALANKETLVVAGEMIMDLCKKYDSELLPVDSEHSAIFQCLVGEKNSEIEKLILTASGGPFLNWSKLDLQNVTVKEALDHPNWSMGNKITIDSATMMNKGLEIIEAHWLFGLDKDRIETVIHPQSIIHSMVEFIDGSIKAQLSLPDMRLPIQYALTFPERLPASFTNTNLTKITKLTFFEPDFNKFECLKLAFNVMEMGGTAPCVLNASNEMAVSRFLRDEIPFLKIPELINNSLEKFDNQLNPDLETLFECDRKTREYVKNCNN